MTDSVPPGPRPLEARSVVSRARFLRILAVLTLCTLVVASVRFARYDWTGIPLERYPAGDVVEVTESCTETLSPYVTDAGREITPVAVDSVQYLSMVEYFRGVDRDDLAASCLYRPYTLRPGVPFVASLLPFDEAVSFGIVNLALTLVAVWFVAATLRRQGIGERALLTTGLLFAVSWNVLFFAAVPMLDAAPVAFVAVGWYLTVRRRWLWVVPLVAVGLLFKETVAVLVPVILTDAWLRRRDEPDRSAWIRAGTAGAMSGVLVLAYLLFMGSVSIEPDATWVSSVRLTMFAGNLELIGLVVFAVAAGPVMVPAFLCWRSTYRREGLVVSLQDPAVVGMVMGLALLTWTMFVADMSARHLWPTYPFACSMAAQWFSQGRGAEWLAQRRLVNHLTTGAGVAVPRAGGARS